ncbi:MAG: hypothetical protein HKN82_13265, partial [Akkermansiaceae bacterium]|nr:hypothetical protein [Akkermansiaceae bacterium]
MALALFSSLACLVAAATAQLQVSVMPSYSQNTAYANADINVPIQVWGRAWGGTPPYTATLDAGDGNGPQAVGAANPDDIGLPVTYNTAGIKTFTLTVTDSAAVSVSRSGTIRVFGAPTKDQLVNMAISKGKRYLYLSQIPVGATQAMWRGRTFDGAGVRTTYSNAATGAALLCLEENGHLPGNDPVADIYAETIQKGLDWLTAAANNFPIGVQSAGDPDSNGNGVGSYLYAGSDESYTNGWAALALVAAEQTAAGAAARTVASGPLAGKSYLDLVTDIIDLFSYSQTDAGTNGGWRYNLRTSNSAPNDASAMQWPSLLFLAASDAWGVSTPPWVLDRTAEGFKVLQAPNGGVGY